MAVTPTKLAQTATGWVNSANATSTSIDVATAFCPLSGATYLQSPSLVLGQFQMDCLGVAFISSLFVRVAAKSDASNPVLYVYLARNGVQRGAIKTIPLTATLEEVVLGGDLWGAALTDADCRNLQVVCYVTALDGGTHSISYCSARASMPDGDAIPDAFSFTAQTGVAFSTVVTSNSVAITGTAIASCVSVANGEWEKNSSGTWSTADGSVSTGDTVKVRHTSAPAAGALLTTTLTVGSVNGLFNSTTTPIDNIPDAINFPSGGTLSEIPLSTWANSGQTAITGINAPTTVSIVGGEYSINGAPFTSAVGVINNTNLLEIRCFSSASFSTLTSCTVTVGGTSRALQVYSATKSGTFTPFFFTTQTGVPTSTVQTSNSITLTTWLEQVNVSIVGGTYNINGGSYTASALPCFDGDVISVRHTSAAAAASSVITTLTATGNTSGKTYKATFTTTTAGGIITPAAFSFASQTNVARTQDFIANAGAITGINVPTPVSVSGTGLVSINGGAYVASGSITTGQTLSVKLTSSAQPGFTTTTTVTVGTVSANYSVTTNYVVNADF